MFDSTVGALPRIASFPPGIAKVCQINCSAPSKNLGFVSAYIFILTHHLIAVITIFLPAVFCSATVPCHLMQAHQEKAMTILVPFIQKDVIYFPKTSFAWPVKYICGKKHGELYCDNSQKV